MRRIGFLVNPIAGMGGRVGLKGTDGLVEEARALGAEPRAGERALRALRALDSHATDVELFTWGGSMGGSLTESLDLKTTVLGEPENGDTTVEDTHNALEAFLEEAVDVILFAGGDGTAVDITEYLTANDADIPIIGIPAGVKIFSSVFAVSPEDAGRIVATFETTEQREVADIDEDAYRKGTVTSTIRGVVSVPVADAVQSTKELGGGSVDAAVAGWIDACSSDETYFLGPGGTMDQIKTALGFDGSPLGVDVWRDGDLLANDANEEILLSYLDDATTIVLSPIGGQGFLFGRGNHQFSPAIIRESTIDIVASPDKLDSIGVLRVDTGDPELDKELQGWVKVRTGRVERRMMEIV